MAQWQSAQASAMIGTYTQGLQGERDVVVARVVAAEDTKDQVQTEMTQLRLSQEA